MPADNNSPSSVKVSFEKAGGYFHPVVTFDPPLRFESSQGLFSINALHITAVPNFISVDYTTEKPTAVPVLRINVHGDGANFLEGDLANCGFPEDLKQFLQSHAQGLADLVANINQETSKPAITPSVSLAIPAGSFSLQQ